MSEPSPPVTVLLPLPSILISSFPLPPSTVSLPPPVEILSLPAPPSIMSLPEVPLITSLPLVPKMMLLSIFSLMLVEVERPLVSVAVSLITRFSPVVGAVPLKLKFAELKLIHEGSSDPSKRVAL